jgi:hypothetical protein
MSHLALDFISTVLAFGQEPAALLGYGIDLLPILANGSHIARFLKHSDCGVDNAGAWCIKTVGTLFKGTYDLITIARFVLYHVKDNVL